MNDEEFGRLADSFSVRIRGDFNNRLASAPDQATTRARNDIDDRRAAYLEVEAAAPGDMAQTTAPSAKTMRSWAAVDARDFLTIESGEADKKQLEAAASTIVANMRSNPQYKTAMMSSSPAVSARVVALDVGADTSTARASDSKAIANTIEREQQRALETEAPVKKPEAERRGGNEVESDEVFTASHADQRVVPVDVERKYLRVGDKFYFTQNTSRMAFEDRGNRLETDSNSEQIAESLVRIAEARGWDEIKVSGSETFRREAWLEAAARGMHVKGYTPSEADRAALAKRVGEQKADASVDHDKPAAERENKEKAKAYQEQSATEATKRFPELLGTVGVVAAIQKQIALEQRPPVGQAAIMRRVHENAAKSIERGELVPPSKIREEKIVERNYAREIQR